MTLPARRVLALPDGSSTRSMRWAPCSPSRPYVPDRLEDGDDVGRRHLVDFACGPQYCGPSVSRQFLTVISLLKPEAMSSTSWSASSPNVGASDLASRSAVLGCPRAGCPHWFP